jgi:hypothetical protein
MGMVWYINGHSKVRDRFLPQLDEIRKMTGSFFSLIDFILILFAVIHPSRHIETTIAVITLKTNDYSHLNSVGATGFEPPTT